MSETRMDRAFIVERLLELSENGLDGVVFASPDVSIRPENPAFHVTAQPWARFVTVVSGSRRVYLPVESGSGVFDLRPGDGYYVPPGAWEGATEEVSYQTLCVVPRDRFLRVAWHHIDNHHLGANYSIFHHTDHPCSIAMDLAMKTLLGLSEADDATVALQGLVVVHLALAECRRDPKRQKSKALRTFERMRSWIDFNLASDIERGEMARRFDVSPSYVSQLFRKITGKGFQTQVTLWRLERATQMLALTDLPVGGVADQCGFRNASHFGRRFKECNGVSPGQFRAFSKPPEADSRKRAGGAFSHSCSIVF